MINRDNMGKYQQCGATCDAVVSSFMLNPAGGFTGAIFSVPAYFNGFVYYQGVNQVLNAFSLTNGTLSSSPVSQSSTSFGFPGATPSISANGTSNGIVWTIQVDGYYNGTPAVLHAYDALNLSSELYNSNKIAADQLASGVKFNLPTIANGKVYVPTQTQLSVFGLAPLGAPSSLTATAVNSSQINLAWSQATGAVGYQIEQCQGANCTSFTQIGTSTSTSFSNTGLTASTSYSYRVRATDASGNLSAYSNTATATTPVQDTQPPTAPRASRPRPSAAARSTCHGLPPRTMSESPATWWSDAPGPDAPGSPRSAPPRARPFPTRAWRPAPATAIA